MNKRGKTADSGMDDCAHKDLIELVAGDTPRNCAADDATLSFLRERASSVLQSCSVDPGACAGGKLPAGAIANRLGFRAITPGGYPSVWVQDFTMNYSSGLISRADGMNHFRLFLEKQNGPEAKDLGHGVVVPPYAVADHINLDGSPVFFPGTYDPSAHQNGAWGFRPPMNNAFDVIWLARMLASEGDAKALLEEKIGNMTVYDRLQRAFEVPEADVSTGLAFTTAEQRAVGFIFCDSIEMTGYLLTASIIRYRAGIHMAWLADSIGSRQDAERYRDISQKIRSHLMPVFGDADGTRGGWLRASTGLSSQPDVWGTIYAIYTGAVDDGSREQLLETVVRALRNGDIEFEGALRHVPLSADFSKSTAWERTRTPLNRYQNGAYWHTPTGWLIEVLQSGHPDLAQDVLSRWLNHLRAQSGKIWECIGRETEAMRYPAFAPSITLPLGVLTRRHGKAVTAAAGLLLSEALSCGKCDAANSARSDAPPNIVLILADDLGYGDLGCYGQTRYKTPQLDRMAAEGAKLTHFNCPAAYCAPTRAALLTGRYPFRCGMNRNPAPDGNQPDADALHLPESEITLAQLLKQGGYATGMIGKWHLGHAKPEWLPARRGFDEYYGIPYSNDMRPVQVLEGGQRVEYPVVQATLTQRYTARALDFIERNQAGPFFLYLAHAMPHKPLAVSEAFYKKSGAGLYGDAVAELDWSVGEVLAKLKTLGLADNTLVMFTSDNGATFGGCNGSLRGMKGGTYEGGYRVPCIAWWPGKIPAGRLSSEPAVTMDLFATTLNVAGIMSPKDRIIDGRNIFPLFTSDAKSPHEIIFGQRGANLSTVRDARWKLHVLPPSVGVANNYKPGDHIDPPRAPDGVTILAPYEQAASDQIPGLMTGDAPGPMQLFDLKNDPGEQHDVAVQHPDIVGRLKKAFDQMETRPHTEP